MPVYTVVPTTDYADDAGQWSFAGAASRVVALGDSLDTSYVFPNGPNADIVSMTFGNAQKTGTSGRFVSACVGMRYKINTYTNGWGKIYLITGGGTWYAGPTTTPQASFTTVEIPPNQGLTPAQCADNTGGLLYPVALTFDNNLGYFANWQIAEAYTKLYFLPAGVVSSISAPTGTITTTQMPTMTAALSITVESWQNSPGWLTGGDVEFQVFRSADAPGSTPPAGVTPLSDTFVRYSSTAVGTNTPSISGTPAVNLPNDTYVVFARVARDVPEGSRVYWSSWTKSASWVQNVPPPTAPTLTAAQDTANQRVTLSVNVPVTSGYTTTGAVVDVHRQLPDGTWRAVRGDTGLAWTADGVAHAVTADYEASRGVTNTYRVRVTEIYTSSGMPFTSAWAQATATGPATTGTGWNFKALDLIASSWMGANVVGDPTQQTQRVVGALVVLDRSLPVSVGGVSGGMADTYLAIAYGTADVAALTALRDYTGVVLLETGFGDMKYVRITDITWTRAGTPTMPRLHATIKCTEVSSGLLVSAT